MDKACATRPSVSKEELNTLARPTSVWDVEETNCHRRASRQSSPQTSTVPRRSQECVWFRPLGGDRSCLCRCRYRPSPPRLSRRISDTRIRSWDKLYPSSPGSQSSTPCLDLAAFENSLRFLCRLQMAPRCPRSLWTRVLWAHRKVGEVVALDMSTITSRFSPLSPQQSPVPVSVAQVVVESPTSYQAPVGAIDVCPAADQVVTLLPQVTKWWHFSLGTKTRLTGCTGSRFSAERSDRVVWQRRREPGYVIIDHRLCSGLEPVVGTLDSSSGYYVASACTGPDAASNLPWASAPTRTGPTAGGLVTRGAIWRFYRANWHQQSPFDIFRINWVPLPDDLIPWGGCCPCWYDVWGTAASPEISGKHRRRSRPGRWVIPRPSGFKWWTPKTSSLLWCSCSGTPD